MDDAQKNQGAFDAVTSWFAHPFNSQGSAFNWILFVGLLIIIVWMWNTVLLALMKEV